jgi:hypothetical protein
MGERVAYRASHKGKSLFMVRKQWYLGSTRAELTGLVEEVAGKLMYDGYGLNRGMANIGGGMISLRHDLSLGRLSMALLTAVASPPFDEVVEPDDLNCDINDHGIYEIELIEWNKWYLNQYDVEYHRTWEDHGGGSTLGPKRHLATINFTEGEPLSSGMRMEFHVPDDWEYPEEDPDHNPNHVGD